MSAEKFRVVIYTNTCEKKVSYIVSGSPEPY
ncbi:PilI type IV pilus biogenesis protein [Escherichia coli]|nr:PilI type IV pilus biogenesis protein [Escherichia coli]